MDHQIQKIEALLRQITEIRMEHYVEHELFSYQWWTLLVMLIGSWIVWWKLVDRSRLLELCLVGALVAICAASLDYIGSTIPLWSYPMRLIPVGTLLPVVDLSVLPVSYMLIVQYFPKCRHYLIASFLQSGAYSFLAEHLLEKMKIYQMISWNHWYSFVFYFGISLMVYWISRRVLQITKNERT
ncbi:CBO0543 family protein [Effusibacillus consociatus]|uniref:CBO0543 family protein n=1 Tax=Effusibacillus consociatus TaxID=1117041 RepID=A0ABV9Q304_9BACL